MSLGKWSASGLKQIVEKLKNQCHRDTTRMHYYRVWKNFNKFLLNLDKRPERWEDRIVLYVGFLISKKRQSTTIKSYLSAIRAVLKQDKVKLKEDEFLLTSLTRACRIKYDAVRIKLPIQKGMLKILLKETKRYFEQKLNQPYLSTLYQTIICTAYYGLFRIGELTAGDHPVLARDVFLGTNKKKILFMLRSSKTLNKGSKPQTVKINSQKQSSKRTKKGIAGEPEEDERQFCPYELLRKYSKLRGPCNKNSKGQFFVFSDGSAVKASNMRACFKKILKRAKFDSSKYSFHCLRSGRTHDLLKYGLSVETIKKLGR